MPGNHLSGLSQKILEKSRLHSDKSRYTVNPIKRSQIGFNRFQQISRADGGIGRRTALKMRRGNSCEFESRSAHCLKADYKLILRLIV